MGYITLDRKLMDNWLWTDTPFSRGQAFIDLIFLANYEDSDFLTGNTLIHEKRGTVYRSKKWLANRWGWSEKKVRCFLEVLEKDGIVVVTGLRLGRMKGTSITIVKYDDYQLQGRSKGRSKDGGRTDEGRTKDDIKEKRIKENKGEENITAPLDLETVGGAQEEEEDDGWESPEEYMKGLEPLDKNKRKRRAYS